MSTQPGGAAETRKVKREPGGGGAMERGLEDCKSSERENKEKLPWGPFTGEQESEQSTEGGGRG